MSKSTYLGVLTLAAGMAVSSTASAYTVELFGPDAFDADVNVMNANLGLTGMAFESFGDAATLDELVEEHADEQFFDPEYSAGGFEQYWAWEGTHAYVIRPVYVTFTYAPGTNVFGVGIANDEESDGEPFTYQINGTGPEVDITTMAAWMWNDGRDDGRNGYLRIEAEPGDPPITSVTFTHAGTGDGVGFDHLAVDGNGLEPADLQITGACPGPVTISLTGFTPGGTVALLKGDGPGSEVFPGGPCAGIPSGLVGLFLHNTFSADALGTVTLNPTLPDRPCGRWLQGMDVATCSLSPAKEIE